MCIICIVTVKCYWRQNNAMQPVGRAIRNKRRINKPDILVGLSKSRPIVVVVASTIILLLLLLLIPTIALVSSLFFLLNRPVEITTGFATAFLHSCIFIVCHMCGFIFSHREYDSPTHFLFGQWYNEHQSAANEKKNRRDLTSLSSNIINLMRVKETRVRRNSR